MSSRRERPVSTGRSNVMMSARMPSSARSSRSARVALQSARSGPAHSARSGEFQFQSARSAAKYSGRARSAAEPEANFRSSRPATSQEPHNNNNTFLATTTMQDVNGNVDPESGRDDPAATAKATTWQDWRAPAAGAETGLLQGSSVAHDGLPWWKRKVWKAQTHHPPLTSRQEEYH